MLIHKRDIEKMKKRGVGERIIAYFEKYRNSGYNTDDLVYLPDELTREAKELGISDNVVDMGEYKFVWDGKRWVKVEIESQDCELVLDIEIERNYREYIEKNGFCAYTDYLKRLYFQIEKKKRKEALRLIKSDKKLGEIKRSLDLTIDEVCSVLEMNIVKEKREYLRDEAI